MEYYRKKHNLNLILKLVLWSKKTAKSGLNKAKELGKKSFYSNIIQETIGKVINGIAQIFGKDPLNISKNLGKDAYNVIKKALPQTMISYWSFNLWGLKGSGFGFLGGLAIGVGVHIIKNYDNVSRSFFGDKYLDEDGN